MQPTRLYTEDELVTLLKARDKDAFAFLYEKYSSALYTIILQMMPGYTLAPDLLQEAFISIWSKFDCYDKTKGRLFTWMLTITRNLCIDTMRSKSYKNNRQNIALGEESEQDLFAKGATVAIPDTVNYIGLSKAVQRLQPQQRELINLAYFRGYTQSEIAGIENMPKGTVKTKIRKALLELREHLQ